MIVPYKADCHYWVGMKRAMKFLAKNTQSQMAGNDTLQAFQVASENHIIVTSYSKNFKEIYVNNSY